MKQFALGLCLAWAGMPLMAAEAEPRLLTAEQVAARPLAVPSGQKAAGSLKPALPRGERETRWVEVRSHLHADGEISLDCEPGAHSAAASARSTQASTQ